MANLVGAVLVQQMVAADRLRRQREVFSAGFEAGEAAVLALQGDPGGAGLAERDGHGLTGPDGEDRRQSGAPGEAQQADVEVVAGGGGQAHGGEQGALGAGGDLMEAAVHVPPDRVDAGEGGELVEFGVGDAVGA